LKRIFLSILLLSVCQFVFGQAFKFPQLPVQGKLTNLVPANWKVVDSVSGDLNGDGIKDLALILEFYRPVKESRAYGDNNTEIITEIQKPRMLAIYFRRSAAGAYKLITQNNNFILRSEEGGAMGDPLRPMAIQRNRLSLSFEGGGNWRWKLNYAFKYQHQDWYLEKAGNYAYNDDSGDMTDRQYDFLDNKKTTVTGKIHNRNSGNESSEQKLSIKIPRSFTNFKKPWTWELADGEYL
jgi:hypothetical protein